MSLIFSRLSVLSVSIARYRYINIKTKRWMYPDTRHLEMHRETILIHCRYLNLSSSCNHTPIDNSVDDCARAPLSA